MVKLNPDLIIKKVLKIICLDDQEKADALKKVNHLCVCNKFIHKIDDLTLLTNLAVLYLHENKILKIENLDRNLNLTHLYLQNNEITKIENLNHLRKLKKLYLGHNKITVVESLKYLDCLEELHIESQKLPPGESLYFDPRTVKALSTTLRMLDISNNQMSSLDDLQEFQALEELDASNNCISNLQATCKVIGHWLELHTLFLRGNPLTQISRYPEKITAFTHKLSNLDGKIIKEETRKFLQRFEVIKVERKKAEEKRSGQYRFSSDIESLAEHLPPGIRNSVSRSILKETVPSVNNLTLSFQQIPAVKEISLERRALVHNIKKNYNLNHNSPKSELERSEFQLP